MFITRKSLPRRTFLRGGGATLALPLLGANSGVTNERWFLPRVTEARHGAEMLTAVRSDNASIPVYVIVSSTDGKPLLAAAHLQALFDYGRALEADKRAGVLPNQKR